MEELQALIAALPQTPLQVLVVATFCAVFLFTTEPTKVLYSTLAIMVLSIALDLPFEMVGIPAAANIGVLLLTMVHQGIDLRSKYYPWEETDLGNTQPNEQ